MDVGLHWLATYLPQEKATMTFEVVKAQAVGLLKARGLTLHYQSTERPHVRISHFLLTVLRTVSRGNKISGCSQVMILSLGMVSLRLWIFLWWCINFPNLGLRAM